MVISTDIKREVYKLLSQGYTYEEVAKKVGTIDKNQVMGLGLSWKKIQKRQERQAQENNPSSEPEEVYTRGEQAMSLPSFDIKQKLEEIKARQMEARAASDEIAVEREKRRFEQETTPPDPVQAYKAELLDQLRRKAELDEIKALKKAQQEDNEESGGGGGTMSMKDIMQMMALKMLMDKKENSAGEISPQIQLMLQQQNEQIKMLQQQLQSSKDRQELLDIVKVQNQKNTSPEDLLKYQERITELQMRMQDEQNKRVYEDIVRRLDENKKHDKVNTTDELSTALTKSITQYLKDKIDIKRVLGEEKKEEGFWDKLEPIIPVVLQGASEFFKHRPQPVQQSQYVEPVRQPVSRVEPAEYVDAPQDTDALMQGGGGSDVSEETKSESMQKFLNKF